MKCAWKTRKGRKIAKLRLFWTTPQRQSKVLVQCLYLTTWTPQLSANLEKKCSHHKCFISFQWALELKSPSPTSTLPSHSSQGSVCKEGSCHSVDWGGLSNVCWMESMGEVPVFWRQYSAIVYVPVNLSPTQRKRTEHDMHRQPTAGFWVLLHWLKSDKIEEISYKQLTSLCNEEICGTLHVPRKQTRKQNRKSTT